MTKANACLRVKEEAKALNEIKDIATKNKAIYPPTTTAKSRLFSGDPNWPTEYTNKQVGANKQINTINILIHFPTKIPSKRMGSPRNN